MSAAPEVKLNAAVRVSCGLSCGCIWGKSPTIRALDADTLPGKTVICDYHDEHAIVIRVSVYLADLGATNLAALFREGGIDPVTAASIASDQT